MYIFSHCSVIRARLLDFAVTNLQLRDPFNKYRMRNFHPMKSNSLQFAFLILFYFVYCLRLIKTRNVIETYSVLIKRIYKLAVVLSLAQHISKRTLGGQGEDDYEFVVADFNTAKSRSYQS